MDCQAHIAIQLHFRFQYTKCPDLVGGAAYHQLLIKRHGTLQCGCSNTYILIHRKIQQQAAFEQVNSYYHHGMLCGCVLGYDSANDKFSLFWKWTMGWKYLPIYRLSLFSKSDSIKGQWSLLSLLFLIMRTLNWTIKSKVEHRQLPFNSQYVCWWLCVASIDL